MIFCEYVVREKVMFSIGVWAGGSGKQVQLTLSTWNYRPSPPAGWVMLMGGYLVFCFLRFQKRSEKFSDPKTLLSVLIVVKSTLWVIG